MAQEDGPPSRRERRGPRAHQLWELCQQWLCRTRAPTAIRKATTAANKLPGDMRLRDAVQALSTSIRCRLVPCKVPSVKKKQSHPVDDVPKTLRGP